MNRFSSRKKVPVDRLPLLNFTVGDAFCRDRYLSSVTNKLYKAGVIRLGQLVSLSEENLFDLVKTTAGNRDRVKRNLEAFGLGLNMDVPQGAFTTASGFPPRAADQTH